MLPLSVKVRRLFAPVSLMVKTLLVPVPRVSTGLALDKVKGFELDKVIAALELAPL